MKKSLLLLFISTLLSTNLAWSQCAETPVERVLLMGDSWAAMMGTDNSINIAFTKWGHSNYKFYTNSVLSENGTETVDFIQPARLTEIQTQLLARPTIDFVHISLGGNDVLGQWNKNWSQAKTDSLLDSVSARLVFIMDFIKSVRPGIRILWSGYAYPNFGEIIGDQAPFQSSHPFYGTWNGMGQPNFTQINGILNYYSTEMAAIADNDPQIDFVNATGLIQYAFGQATPLTITPNASYPAFTAPLPLGYPDYPSPKNAMRNYVIFKDCFHLSPASFEQFVGYHTRKFYQKALMDDQFLIATGGASDGSVSAQGLVSSSLMVGNSSGDDYASVLTFNTTTMPDTGVSAATIFLRRESLTGTNPIGSNMVLKVASGSFGASANIEPTDFQALGDANGNPCQFGTSNADGGWIRLEVPAALLPFITHTTNTQFMLSAPGASGMVTFTGSADPELAPVLNLTYGPQTTSLAEAAPVDLEKLLMVFPNPTSNTLFINNRTGKDISKIEIVDMPGRLIYATSSSVESIDLSNLKPGSYLVKFTTESGQLVVKRIVKR
ncbi:MAG: SGNH/GDSL hydrolase family protein [Bacteroidota bacterium]